mmetsp:Transcript_8585/g.13021  ORF Transcript_8585/g.13021 Transcript_8585/m.13021 type:complete len:215 (-) Transcript_8585:93-737(-)
MQIVLRVILNSPKLSKPDHSRGCLDHGMGVGGQIETGRRKMGHFIIVSTKSIKNTGFSLHHGVGPPNVSQLDLTANALLTTHKRALGHNTSKCHSSDLDSPTTSKGRDTFLTNTPGKPKLALDPFIFVMMDSERRTSPSHTMVFLKFSRGRVDKVRIRRVDDVCLTPQRGDSLQHFLVKVASFTGSMVPEILTSSWSIAVNHQKLDGVLSELVA